MDATIDVLEAVRARTRELHAALDAAPIWDSAFADVAAYRRLLLAYRGLVAPADVAIERCLGDQAPPDFVASARTSWLDQDLAALDDRLGSSSSGDSIVDRSDDDWAFVGRSRADAAGAAYVLAGSALGGQFIAKRVEASFGLGPKEGARYFFGHGGETGRRWKEFVGWFRGNFTTPGDAELAADAAVRTFELFRIAFAESVTAPASSSS